MTSNNAPARPRWTCFNWPLERPRTSRHNGEHINWPPVNSSVPYYVIYDADPVLVNVMRPPPTPFLRKNRFFLVIKDAQCSETDFALILTILKFIIFEIWSMVEGVAGKHKKFSEFVKLPNSLRMLSMNRRPMTKIQVSRKK